ncbi:MAG: hypothetical protein AAFY02_00640 [Pseudomonadota bacterium]
MNQLQKKFTETAAVTSGQKSAELSGRKRPKPPPPFSLRLNKEERTKLETAAAGLPLGHFIKAKLFDGDLTPRRTRGHTPVKDHAALARALGLLGNLRLANNLNQLAKAVNMGTLSLSPEIEEELLATCAAVLAIRMELMKALGYEVDGKA